MTVLMGSVSMFYSISHIVSCKQGKVMKRLMATSGKVELGVGVWWMLQNLAAGLCVPNG